MVVKQMCDTGRPLGGPCKHCSVTALITDRGMETAGGGGMETKGKERIWKGEDGREGGEMEGARPEDG